MCNFNFKSLAMIIIKIPAVINRIAPMKNGATSETIILLKR